MGFQAMLVQTRNLLLHKGIFSRASNGMAVSADLCLALANTQLQQRLATLLGRAMTVILARGETRPVRPLGALFKDASVLLRLSAKAKCRTIRSINASPGPACPFSPPSPHPSPEQSEARIRVRAPSFETPKELYGALELYTRKLLSLALNSRLCCNVVHPPACHARPQTAKSNSLAILFGVSLHFSPDRSEYLETPFIPYSIARQRRRAVASSFVKAESQHF